MLWLGGSPLVLASASRVRCQMLQSAGIPVHVAPAALDERALEAGFSGDAGSTAALLAREKARTVAESFPRRVVLGADQVLALNGRRFSKPESRDAARDHLLSLRGTTHELFSAIVVMREQSLVFEHTGIARITMRRFSEAFLDRYLDLAGAGVLDSVGAFRIEGLGVHLFEAIEGDHFTIMGLPLLPLLAFLRTTHLLSA
jgi:nucleoside triphosphate pyrophosphatase